jgi:hypothetical protein
MRGSRSKLKLPCGEACHLASKAATSLIAVAIPSDLTYFAIKQSSTSPPRSFGQYASGTGS